MSHVALRSPPRIAVRVDAAPPLGSCYRPLTGLHDDSTTPEAESEAGPERQARLGVEWVFPGGGATPALFDRPRLVIGRDAECEIRLPLPSVSRRHTEIYRDGPVFALKDLDSRNGTFLNGARVSHAALALGDVLRIGERVGLIVEEPAEGHLDELAPDLFGGRTLSAAVEPARRAASSSLPLVLVGETGTGKERVARALHAWSGRPGPFQAVNCAALPENLVEAELFGHAKGAFTGATQQSAGRFRAAHGGTLLLDEVAELPLQVQPKLLRLLEERVVVPLGDTRAHPVDVRIVAATQVPLETLVERGTFRQDLKARLSGLVVRLPPLRERRTEIVALFLRLLDLHSGGRPPPVEAKLAEALCLYTWPDNVRELDLLVRRLLALHGSEPILRRQFLPDPLQACSDEESALEASPWYPRRSEHDLARLKAALEKTQGNVKAAAQSLGFSRQRAYRLMRRD